MAKSYYDKNKRHIGLGWILLGIIAVLAVIAYFTKPSEESMKENVEKYVKMEISSKTNKKEPTDRDVRKSFYQYNTMQYKEYLFWSAGWLINRFKSKEKLACVGIFGITIPTLDYYDYMDSPGAGHDYLKRKGSSSSAGGSAPVDDDIDGVIPEE